MMKITSTYCSPKTRHCGSAKLLTLIVLPMAIMWLMGLMLPATAQTIIGGDEPDSSAILELKSSERGFLLPRLTTQERDAVVKPQTGLMVFNTTLNCLEVNLGTTTAPQWNCILAAGSIGALDCGNAAVTGTLTAGSAAAGVSARVPYTGGNGSPHSGQTVSSTGVTGLTATLAAGSFASGSDSLTYTISGTAQADGLASFALDIGGKTCTLVVPVGCGAYVAPGQWKVFMCHNLASANTAADPFTPSWEIIGGYWQWGRKGPDPSQWLNTNTPNFAHGPTGSGAGETNEAPISDWDQTFAPDGAWLNAQGQKTGDDPCPSGFRVPTLAQWNAVLANNTQSITGTWTSDPTNYSSGMKFGPGLMLPAAGTRNIYDGQLFFRGNYGYYWSSTESGGAGYAWNLLFSSGGAFTYNFSRRDGLSLRCVAE